MEKVTAPRLVHMIKGDQGYGFNLHGEKNLNAGQTISAVDEGTPAHTGGLLVGDRLVEVNGVNIESSAHSEVVKKIKASGNQVTMLVIDSITDAYLKEQGRPITVDMANLATVVPPVEKPPTPEPEPEPEVQPEPEVRPEPEPEPVQQSEPEQPEPEEPKPEESQPETSTEVQAETSEVVESAAPEIVDSTAEQTENAPPPDEKPSEEVAQNEVDASKKYNLETAQEATTPDEVKQLNHVLHAEQHSEPAPEEIAPPPTAPANNANDNNSNPAPLPKLEMARQRSIPQRNRVKDKGQESWAEKAKRFQSM